VDKAVEMLKKFEKVNKKTVEPEVYEEFEKSCNTMISKDKSHNNYTVLDLFKLPRLGRITVVLIIYWQVSPFIFCPLPRPRRALRRQSMAATHENLDPVRSRVFNPGGGKSQFLSERNADFHCLALQAERRPQRA
jgi:hypothetical protein